MKVTKPTYEWTGEHRPPKRDEWWLHATLGPIKCRQDGFQSSEDIYREVQREHDVPDPVPKIPAWVWALDAIDLDGIHGGNVSEMLACGGCRKNAEKIAAAYRAHVEERAKAATLRYLSSAEIGCMSPDQTRFIGIVLEEFLR